MVVEQQYSLTLDMKVSRVRLPEVGLRRMRDEVLAALAALDGLRQDYCEMPFWEAPDATLQYLR